MKRLVLVASTLGLSACVLTPDAPPPQAAKEPTQTREQQRIVNQSYFDLAACEMKPPAVPATVTSEVLPGVVQAAQPYVMECLVDPRHRGAEKSTPVVVESTLGESGVTHSVTGANLTPEGLACIQTALNKWTQAVPGAKPAQPVTARVEFQHSVDTHPAVTLGVNEASDIVGTLRLAAPSFCGCLEPWKNVAPQPLKVSISVRNPTLGMKPQKNEKGEVVEVPAPPARVNPSAVTFEPAQEPVADQVAACIREKSLQLEFKTPVGELTLLPMPMHFVNSNVFQPLKGDSPDYEFVQLNLLRNRALAEVSIATGARTHAQTTYDDAIMRYMSAVRRKKASAAMGRALLEDWNALVKADDRVIETLTSHLTVEEQMLQFMSLQKESDPAWAEAETAALERVAATQKDLENWTAARKADLAARPK